MVKKIFGWLFLLAGIGNFIGNFAKSSANRPDAFKDIGFGIFFLGLGIYLLVSSKPKQSTGNPPVKNRKKFSIELGGNHSTFVESLTYCKRSLI